MQYVPYRGEWSLVVPLIRRPTDSQKVEDDGVIQAAVLYPSMELLWPDVYAAKNVQEVEVRRRFRCASRMSSGLDPDVIIKRHRAATTATAKLSCYTLLTCIISISDSKTLAKERVALNTINTVHTSHNIRWT